MELIKLGRVWVEPMPGPCPKCGDTRVYTGWISCVCEGAENRGHRIWWCTQCFAQTAHGHTASDDSYLPECEWPKVIPTELPRNL